MNIIELEPARVLELNSWWMKPQAADLLTCLEKSAQKAMSEFAELSTKARADKDNPQYSAAAQEKLCEAADYETTVTILKAFFPDGPFIQRIEL